MALINCLHCNKRLLTEADPYLVFPHSSGYHTFCLDCIVEDVSVTYSWLLNQIKNKESNRG